MRMWCGDRLEEAKPTGASTAELKIRSKDLLWTGGRPGNIPSGWIVKCQHMCLIRDWISSATRPTPPLFSVCSNDEKAQQGKRFTTQQASRHPRPTPATRGWIVAGLLCAAPNNKGSILLLKTETVVYFG